VWLLLEGELVDGMTGKGGRGDARARRQPVRAREGEVEGQRHAVLAGQDLLQVPAHEQVEE